MSTDDFARRVDENQDCRVELGKGPLQLAGLEALSLTTH